MPFSLSSRLAFYVSLSRFSRQSQIKVSDGCCDGFGLRDKNRRKPNKDADHHSAEQNIPVAARRE
jgi:hypothetical protein